MSVWIKICGNTSLDDAKFAAECGASAVGFVFAPSPRRVTASQVAPIVTGLPEETEKIGVFVDSSFDEIVETVKSTGLTGVQLHSAMDEVATRRLRNTFGPGFRILRVLHFDAETVRQIEVGPDAAAIDAVLVDSRTPTAVGGTGIRFDWELARTALFDRLREQTRLIAAGGMTPENVAEAIATLAPWGVDVASGVESSPGRKDQDKVRAFIQNACAAQQPITGGASKAW